MKQPEVLVVSDRRWEGRGGELAQQFPFVREELARNRKAHIADVGDSESDGPAPLVGSSSSEDELPTRRYE